jgi:radical SAM-linked protein
LLKGILRFLLRLPTFVVEILTVQNRPHLFFSHFDQIGRLCFCTINDFNHYSEDVDARMHLPAIPAEALARQARLQAALQAMEVAGPSREPAALQGLRAALAGRPTQDLESLITMLINAELAEEAGELLRAARHAEVDVEAFGILTSRMTPLAAKSRQRRSAAWQLDSRRALIRLQYAKEGAALGFDDGDLHTIFLHAFRLEGVRLALDLGKRPRPLLSTALPLPAGVGGWSEIMDAVLTREPQESPVDLVARLNRRLPEGLRIEQWNSLPGYAAGVGELAVMSHWRWLTPVKERTQIEDRMTAFMAAEAWPWDRGDAKAGAPLDLRHIVQDLHWVDGALCFSTRMGAFLALNPVKVLAAILALDSTFFLGLVRTAVDLRPDARLDQAERFEPKLKNMYEDAVLLGGGSNIVLVEEDDDEPLLLR